MNPRLCSAAAAPTPQPLPRPRSRPRGQDPHPGRGGDAPGEVNVRPGLCAGRSGHSSALAQPWWLQTQSLAQRQPGFILPTARDVTDSNYSPLLIVHNLLGAVWAQQAGHMSPLARRSSSSAVTTLPLQIPLVPASRPASGPGWPWGSLSPVGITVPFGRPPLPLGTSQLCQLLPKEPCAALARAPHRQREGRGC